MTQTEQGRRSHITILETSDLHGNMFPIHYANNKHNNVGLSKIAALIAQERAHKNNVIVLDNGDLIQGTPLAYHHARLDNEPMNPMVLGLNYLKYDAAVLGNHEFNYGMNVLQKAVRESNFPWLCANILSEETGEPFFGKPYLIKQFPDGVRVGILGITTPYIPNWEDPKHIVGLRFEDPIATARTWVQFLREQEHVDVVVVSYHGGFERDIVTGEPTEPLTGENQGYQLCMEVEGIDVLLTGHQHRSIAGVHINGVTIVQPGTAGVTLGKVDIELDQVEGKWRIASKQSELLPVDNVEADTELLAQISSYEAKTQLWLDQPIGKLTGDMLVKDPMQIRTADNALIEFINKVQMELSGAQISNTALFDNISPGFPSDITMRDIVSNYIYPNTLKVIRISGQDIKDALEQSAEYFELADGVLQVSKAFMEPKPAHYNYDMWEGISYTLNIARPVGNRVVQLDFKGEPIDLEASFEVVMNNYRAAGGGNYAMFQNKPVVKDIPTDVAELLAGYIMERGTIEASVNHNWQVIWT
ncbi:bifunctional UDP-sugar hydrolase/5'-nucleotidase [Paenibacillus qinlingensis]|uniref:2',3'-cyclic-nucleotide 2'-phosphodiesterase/3'-nucleotidase n=1 Tax=Paenibacillus qinlingensis TaxID=1837343 RepID=A0ABU1P1T6_9BACL|nr:bifunctional UDP-sugar hydrolase/5'-nucleotidase [Paenibacillus qinlingensis]MDR6553708.1 2',3'-cyclic-nucleotide 2'-phosphodiesterase/3'-nucleotidase [Paenibacillus qinlingensis]